METCASILSLSDYNQKAAGENIFNTSTAD